VKLKGKVALITGAARGIGRGIAEVFADEGANVAVNDVDNMPQAEEVVRGIRSKGPRALAVQADVASRADVEPMIEKVWNELGPIDILVNNAVDAPGRRQPSWRVVVLAGLLPARAG
jgi:NAD(P)-dependent dehydrogenase (short-subunit alcohol dehydrogenase family)